MSATTARDPIISTSKLAPRAFPPARAPIPRICCFNYDEAAAFYKMNAGTVRVNKRLTKGISMGANYQYGHAIDDATSVNGSGGSVVQDWQNPCCARRATRSSIFATRSAARISTSCPSVPDKFWVTSGVGSHILEGFSVSGSFNFATGAWLSPELRANVAERRVREHERPCGRI